MKKSELKKIIMEVMKEEGMEEIYYDQIADKTRPVDAKDIRHGIKEDGAELNFFPNKQVKPSRTEHYFAMDGNYGDARGMLMLDTTKWTDEDWDEIEEASDSERVGVAKIINQRKK